MNKICSILSRYMKMKQYYLIRSQERDRKSKFLILIHVSIFKGWKRHGSFCYFVGTETKTFDEAKEDCKASGSYLADVSNG